ncbi:uncharacterized protein METZ01_LOCUS428586, partial [marine metagenome]
MRNPIVGIRTLDPPASKAKAPPSINYGLCMHGCVWRQPILHIFIKILKWSVLSISFYCYKITIQDNSYPISQFLVRLCPTFCNTISPGFLNLGLRDF